MQIIPVSVALSDAPQISPSSRCNFIQDFFNSSCEVHGNPSPKLEWRLSGQIVRPSEFISTSESASNTTLRSFISIRTSLNGSLQCVGSNKLGVASQIFSCMKVDQCSAAKGQKLHKVNFFVTFILKLTTFIIFMAVYMNNIDGGGAFDSPLFTKWKVCVYKW